MKRLKYAILLILTILTSKSHSDIIMSGQFAKINARIINLNDYPGIAVFGVWDMTAAPKPLYAYQVESSSWLKLHFAHPLSIYSVKKEHLENLDVKEMRWRDDKKVIKSNLIIEATTTDIPKSVSAVQIDYKIAGFNDTIMVLYKSKEVYKYGKLRPDSVKYFSYEGDLSKIHPNFN